MPSAAIANYQVWLDNENITARLAEDLDSISVEDNLYRPDTFAIRLRNPLLSSSPTAWQEGSMFKPGQSLKIRFHSAPDNTLTGGTQKPKSNTYEPRLEHQIDGEITGLEVELEEDGTLMLTVRGYDRSYLLQQGQQTRSFVQMTDSDIVKQLGGEVGLDTSNVEPTTEVYEYILQVNQSQLDFLQSRSRRIGYELFVDGTHLYFRPTSQSQPELITLTPGNNLLSFRAQHNQISTALEVIVRGWNPLSFQEIVGQAKTELLPGNGGQSSITPRQTYQFARAVATQAEAEQVAKGLLERIVGQQTHVEGTARGEPSLRAGTWLGIDGLGAPFSGRYYLSTTTHTYSSRGETSGYSVSFSSHVGYSGEVGELLGSTEAQTSFAASGPVPGLVTNLNDPEKLGRVKIRWPHLGPSAESHWARIASPHSGLIMRPAINQEVLVAFEDGDINRPYVLGSLWNARTSPPLSYAPNARAEVVADTNHFVIATSGGNQIVLRDHPTNAVTLAGSSGASVEVCTTKDGSGVVICTDNKRPDQCWIRLEQGKNLIRIETEGDIEIKNRGNFKLAAGSIELTAKESVVIKGQTIDLN